MRQLASLLVRLNLETRMHHAAADNFWLGLVKGSRRPSRHEYMQRLVRAYGVEGPLEASLRYTRGFDQLVDMTGRYRAGLIAQDLLSLGLGPAQVATIPQMMIEPFAHVAEALGWLYVHERGMVVHQNVRRHLCDQIPELEHATSYLSAYDGVVGARMEDLGEQLDRLVRARVIADRVVLAAQDAFAHALGWLHEPEVVALAR